jgi:para-nitrobenzyl esterase
MFWIHGGGYSNGSGGRIWFDGTNLARRQDVVVVGINHRLNVFGYLYLAEVGGAKYADSANVGMLDIVQALRWVRDNIGGFGGDPGNVTIFGQSGGGSKVSNLMAMPSAKGLFHKAIVESGSALRMPGPDTAAKSTERILKVLGVQKGNVDRLQMLPMEQLIEAVRTASKTGGALPLTPVVDGRALTRHPFDPDAPAQTAAVPMLIGTCMTETTLLIGARDPTTFSLDEAGLRSRVKAFYRTSEPEADRVIDVYRKNRPGASPSLLFFLITSDRTRTNAIAQAERKAAQGAAPAYMYLFAWETPVLGGRIHTPHDTEMLFVFDNVHTAPGLLGTGKDLQPLADKTSGAWAAFARSGNPSQPGLAWPAYTPAARATMVFDRETRVVNDPSRDERVAVQKLVATT